MPIYKRQDQDKVDPKRKFFTSLRENQPANDLIEVQKTSYEWFFMQGIKELFDEISPITDFTGRDLEVYFEDYFIDSPKFDEVVC